MTHGSLFSGIGGFDLAAEWMGWTNVFNCEWEEFPRQVLKHHFPNAQQYADIREFDATTYARRIDIISGGFPRQPYSVAGERKGSKTTNAICGRRCLELFESVHPVGSWARTYAGLLLGTAGWFSKRCVLTWKLAGTKFNRLYFLLRVGAPHKRERIWFVAHADDKGRRTGYGKVSSSNGEVPERNDSAKLSYTNTGDVAHAHTGQREQSQEEVRPRGDASNTNNTLTLVNQWERFPTVAPVCGGDDGLPKRLDGITFPKWRRESIKAYGNAIVPQVAHQIFKAIYLYEQGCK